MSTQAQRRNDLLEDVEAHVVDVLRKRGISDADASVAGIATADFLAKHWGGSVLTFPKDCDLVRQRRDAAMLAKFTGTNYHELSREYDMTERGIRKALARAQERARHGK